MSGTFLCTASGQPLIFISVDVYSRWSKTYFTTNRHIKMVNSPKTKSWGSDSQSTNIEYRLNFNQPEQTQLNCYHTLNNELRHSFNIFWLLFHHAQPGNMELSSLRVPALEKCWTVQCRSSTSIGNIQWSKPHRCFVNIFKPIMVWFRYYLTTISAWAKCSRPHH